MKKNKLTDEEIINIAREASRLLLDKKGRDVLLMDLREINSYLDYFIITSGNSFVHCRALAKELQKYFKERGLPERTKSRLDTDWIALDYSEIVVHIFTQEIRDFYQLERLWADSRFIEIKEPHGSGAIS